MVGDNPQTGDTGAGSEEGGSGLHSAFYEVQVKYEYTVCYRVRASGKTDARRRVAKGEGYTHGIAVPVRQLSPRTWDVHRLLIAIPEEEEQGSEGDD